MSNRKQRGRERARKRIGGKNPRKGTCLASMARNSLRAGRKKRGGVHRADRRKREGDFDSHFNNSTRENLKKNGGGLKALIPGFKRLGGSDEKRIVLSQKMHERASMKKVKGVRACRRVDAIPVGGTDRQKKENSVSWPRGRAGGCGSGEGAGKRVFGYWEKV